MDDMRTNGSPPTTHKRRRGRWIIGIVAGVLAVLLLLVALVPTLLSTAPGIRWVAGVITDNIAGSVSIADASFGWFGGQSLSDVVLRDPQDDIVARIARIEAPDLSLLPVIFGSRALGVINVAVTEANIHQPVDGPTNIEQAIGPIAPTDPTAPTQIGELSVELNLTAERITYESPDIEPVELTDVMATAAIPQPRQITLKLASALRQGDTTGRLAADVAVNDAFNDAGVMQLEQAKIEGEAAVENLPVPMIDRLAQQDGLLVALLGQQLSAQVQTRGGIEELGAQVVARSERLTVDTALSRTGRGLVASGGTIRLQFTPDAFAKLATPAPEADGEAAAPPQLLQPFTLNVDLRSLMLPSTAEGVQIADAQFDASVTSEPIVLDVPEQGRVAVRDFVLALRSEDLSELVTAQLDAQAEIAGVSGPVHATVGVSNLLMEAEPLTARLQAERLPVVLVDAVAAQGGKLVQMLGETLTADVTVTRQATGELLYAGRIDTPNLTGPFEGRYGADGALTLTTPEPVALTLTPAAYRTWVLGGEPAEGQWVLASPASLQIGLEELVYAPVEGVADVSADAPLRIDPERTQIVGQIDIASAAFFNPQTQQRVGITNGTIGIEGRDLREVLKIVANLNLQPSTPAPSGAISSGPAPTGAITSNTELRGLFSDAGELQPMQAQIVSDTELREVPSGLIDSLANQGGELAALLGPVTSLKADVNYRPDGSGRVDVTLDTSNIKGQIPATVDETGTVRLREDAELSVNVTPEVSRVLLGKVTPMLASAVSAQVPLKLRVAAEGFEAPLQTFDWRQVSASAVLDSGQLTLAPQGFTGLVVNAVSRFAKIPLEQGMYQANLRPLPLSIAQGRMRYDNLTLGMAGATFNFGGMVDLAAQQFDLDMTLGGDALPKELRGVTIPIEGPFTNPLSRETLTRALAGAAINIGLQEGLGELLGGQRREQPGTAPQQESGQQQQGQQPQQGEAQPQKPRDPLKQLLDIGVGAIEEERRRQEQERQQRRQESQQQQNQQDQQQEQP